MDKAIEWVDEAIISLLGEISRLQPNTYLTQDKKVEYATLLLNYGSEHFFQEEKEMVYEDYPGLLEHRIDHESLQDLFSRVINQLLSGTCDINQLVDIVNNKFGQHLATVDNAFITWRISKLNVKSLSEKACFGGPETL